MSKLDRLQEELDKMEEMGNRSVYFVKQRDDGKYFECDDESAATHFILGHWPNPVVVRELSELPENYIVKSWKAMYEHFERASESHDEMVKSLLKRSDQCAPHGKQCTDLLICKGYMMDIEQMRKMLKRYNIRKRILCLPITMWEDLESHSGNTMKISPVQFRKKFGDYPSLFRRDEPLYGDEEIFVNLVLGDQWNYTTL